MPSEGPIFCDVLLGAGWMGRPWKCLKRNLVNPREEEGRGSLSCFNTWHACFVDLKSWNKWSFSHHFFDLPCFKACGAISALDCICMIKWMPSFIPRSSAPAIQQCLPIQKFSEDPETKHFQVWKSLWRHIDEWTNVQRCQQDYVKWYIFFLLIFSNRNVIKCLNDEKYIMQCRNMMDK